VKERKSESVKLGEGRMKASTICTHLLIVRNLTKNCRRVGSGLVFLKMGRGEGSGSVSWGGKEGGWGAK